MTDETTDSDDEEYVEVEPDAISDEDAEFIREILYDLVTDAMSEGVHPVDVANILQNYGENLKMQSLIQEHNARIEEAGGTVPEAVKNPVGEADGEGGD